MKKSYYYEQLGAQAGLAVQAAEELAAQTEKYDLFALTDAIERVNEICNREEKIKIEAVQALEKEFLPPLERGDVLLLAQSLCACAKAIKTALCSYYFCNLNRTTDAMLDFAGIIHRQCGLLAAAAASLSEFSKTKTAVISARKMSGQGHDGRELYYKACRQVYTSCRGADEALRVYDALLGCCEMLAETGEAIEGVIIRNL